MSDTQSIIKIIFKPVPMDVMERHFPLQTSNLIFDLNIFVILTAAQ